MKRTVRIPLRDIPQAGDAIHVQVKGYVSAVHVDPLAPLDERVLVDLEIYDTEQVNTSPGTLVSPSSSTAGKDWHGSHQPFYPQQGVGSIGTCS